MYTQPQKIVLENDTVLLTPLTTTDLDAIFSASRDDAGNVFYHMSFGPFIDKTDLLKWMNSEINAPNNFIFTVYSKRLKSIVGTCSIISSDLNNGSSEVGNIWYSKRAQNSEINTSAISLLLSYLFENLKYRRVVWKCDNTNESSKAAALKLGFKFEGIFKKHMIRKSRSRDTIWYAIIDDEWMNVKEALINRIINKKIK